MKRHVDQVRARLTDTVPLEPVLDSNRDTVVPVTIEQEGPPASEPVVLCTPVPPDLPATPVVRRSERERQPPVYLKDFVK